MRKRTFICSMILLVSAGIISCTKDSKEESLFNFQRGVYISNEGPFTTGTGTLSFHDEMTGQVEQDVFYRVNGRVLGNLVQSVSLNNEKAYIVVNNAGKVEVTDAHTMKSLATIQGLTLPRYFQAINDKKAYVTDWAGNVAIVDLISNSVTGIIPAGTGPELMLKSGEKVYVLNGGGYSVDSTVTIINSATDKVIKTLIVSHRPTGIVEDASGKIWVMCSGKGFNGWPSATDTEGKLVRIDPSTLETDMEIPFDDSSKHPEKLAINETKTVLYFLYDQGIFRYNTTLTASSPQRVCSRSNLYALAFDKTKRYLLASDPVDFQSDGWVLRFEASSGKLMDSIQAGIIPGHMVIME